MEKRENKLIVVKYGNIITQKMAACCGADYMHVNTDLQFCPKCGAKLTGVVVVKPKVSYKNLI